MFAPIPLTLYIHIPWCVRKCPYCDFNSHALTGNTAPESLYVDALLADLEQDLPSVWGRRIRSIFIGGGTPSLFSAEAIDRLLCGIRARLPLLPQCEITLEANPGASDRSQFAELHAAGINRISIGVQSFDDSALKRVGRIHDRAAAIAAAESAHAIGLGFNLDLMYGLPEQTITAARTDIRQAIALSPAHLSYYQLTIEQNTAFAHAPPVLPNDVVTDEMQKQAQSLLAEQGYERYEVSAYAKNGARCQHNLNYWQFGDYLGIGAGAHSKITDVAMGSIHRSWKQKHPQDYLAQAHAPDRIQGQQWLQVSELPLEFLMNALRLVEGVPSALFSERTGLTLSALEPGLSRLRERGLLVTSPLRLQTTAWGLQFLNDVLLEFT